MHQRTVLSIRAMIVMAKEITIRCCIAAFALLTIFCVPLVPAWANAIVDTAFVAEALKRGAIVWDVRDAAAYQRGHIGGAINVGDALRVLRNPTTEDFIETERVERYSAEAELIRRARLSCIRPAATSAPISRISPSAISAAKMSLSTTMASTAGWMTSARSKPTRRDFRQ